MDEIRKKMTVAAIPFNKKMVEAWDENQNRCSVDVGDNSNFAIGDEIEVGPHDSGYADIWQLLSGTPQDRRRPNVRDEVLGREVENIGSKPDLVE